MDRKTLLERIGMPLEAVAVIDETEARVKDSGVTEELRRDLLGTESPREIYERVVSGAKELGVGADELSLVLLLNCADETERRMREQGHPERVFVDSMRDLTIWTKFCYRNHGVWGIREFEWLARTIRAELWRMGRLQFERYEYDYPDQTFGDRSVHTGDIVLNTHIPAGGGMTREARYDSYRQAYEYFGIGTFILDSYLLYPAHREFLPPESNIIGIMDEFHLIKSGETECLHNMRYIFDETPDGVDPATLPRDTSLRRAYADWYAKHGKIGWGVGVMFFDGERIL